jgi:hypothetical protein
LAEDCALAGEGDEEGSAACFGQCRCDLRCAAAIGIGLDDGGGFDVGRGEGIQRAPVGGNGVEVDCKLAGQAH